MPPYKATISTTKFVGIPQGQTPKHTDPFGAISLLRIQ
jgi:hypothetical protein